MNAGKTVGYARSSTIDQVAGFEAQERELRDAGCDKIFSELVSSVSERAQLEAAIDYVREDDVFIVCKLDRLARSVSGLLDIAERLDAKNVSLRILNIGIDTSTPTGKLMLNLLGSVAQFEREIMLERQREGIAKAKREGRYKGRQPTALRQKDKVLSMKNEGIGALEIARRLEIGKSSVYRILAAS